MQAAENDRYEWQGEVGEVIVQVGPTDVGCIEHGDVSGAWDNVARVNNGVQGVDNGSDWEVKQAAKEKNGEVGNL